MIKKQLDYYAMEFAGTLRRLHRKLRRTNFFCTRRRAGILLILASIYLVYSTMISWKLICDTRQLNAAIDSLCADYQDGLLLGDLCVDICDAKALVPDQCQTMHFGKEVVFSAKLREKEVYVKGRTLSFHSDQTVPLYHETESDAGGFVRHYPADMHEFEGMVESYLKDNLGIGKVEGNLLNQLWGRETIPEVKTGDKQYERAVMENLWHLLQNNEYVYSSLFQQYDVFPEIYGNCGHFYVVEKVNPLSMPGYQGKAPSFATWTERVNQALKTLDVIDEIETMFEEPMIICDMKHEHFGLSKHNRVKILDSDSIHMKSVADRSVGDGSHCTQHSDCDFLDCRGVCDLVEETCAKGSVVQNDNLQLLCEKVFQGHHDNWLFRPHGLLQSKHATRQLKDLVSFCANPAGSKDGSRVRAGKETKVKLRKMLKEFKDIGIKLEREA